MTRSLMTRSLSIAAAASVLIGGTGCLKPNGKNRVLYFGLELPQGAGNGLSQDVLLPEKKQIGNFAADFNGTSLHAGGNGLVIQEATQLPNDGWRLRVECDPLSNGRVRELAVQIEASGEVRYADAFDLICLQSDRLVVSPPSFDQWIIGASLTVDTTLSARNGSGNATTAQGHGWAVADANSPLQIADWNFLGGTLELTTTKSGANPVLVAGTVSAPIPVTVVDDTAWSLSLSVTRTLSGDDAGAPTASLEATAQITPATIGGLADCAFTVTNGSVTLASTAAADCYGYAVVPALASGQVCVTAARHTACQPYGQ